MVNLSITQKKQIFGFLLALACAWVTYLIPFSGIHTLSSLLYAGIIIVWAVTLRTRITDKTTRRFLLTGAALLVLLFVLRICRWELFLEATAAGKFFWYAYYIPFVITPVISLSVAFFINRGGKNAKALRGVLPLWVIAGILCLGVLTNDLHQFMFPIESYTNEHIAYSYGMLYYVTIGWCILVTVLAFAVLTRGCTLSMSRRLWYIPVSFAAFFLLLSVWYYAGGGSPQIGQVKLYSIQEVYAFLFLFLWESCIEIGLIPSNTGYESIFLRSPFSACISDDSGNIVYQANRMELPNAEQFLLARNKPVMLTDDVRLSGSRIKNGFVFWNEDISFLNELRDQIAEAAERLAEENMLLEYENKTKEERSKVDTQNKLYDEIAVSIAAQLKKCHDLMEAAKADPDEAAQLIARVSVIGAYIKRRSNLAIIAHANAQIDTEELYFSIRESLEYLSLSGAANGLRISGTKLIPAEVLIFFYEFFEMVVESFLDVSASIMVNLSAADAFEMSIMTDAQVDAALLQGKACPGTQVTVKQENDAAYITVSYREGGELA